MKKIFSVLIGALTMLVSCGVEPVMPEEPVNIVQEANLEFGEDSESEMAVAIFCVEDTSYWFYFNQIDSINMDSIMGGDIFADPNLPLKNFRVIDNTTDTLWLNYDYEVKMTYVWEGNDSVEQWHYTLCIPELHRILFCTSQDDIVTCCRPHESDKSEE